MKKQSIHEKAIRLIERGLVNVDGHCVKMKRADVDENACMQCDMDSICRTDSEMSLVCHECDFITGDYCYLELVTNDKEIKQ